MKIGTWNNYSINLMKDKEGNPYWTVTAGKKEVNRFDTPEDFGHWMVHSGFLPDKAKEIEEDMVSKKLGKAKIMLKASGLSIEQLRKFECVFKAKADLIAIKKPVYKKGKMFQQTFYVRAAKPVPESQLSVYTLGEDDIQKFKKELPAIFMKIVTPVADHWYATTNLGSVNIDRGDARQEAYLVAYKALMSYKTGGKAKLSTMINTFIQRKFYNLYSTAKKRVTVPDRFETLDNLKSAVGAEIFVEMEEAAKEAEQRMDEAVRRINVARTGAEAELGGMTNAAEYKALFKEWLDGKSLKEMADKRGISRVAVASKFKRFIYPAIRNQGLEPEQMSVHAIEKQKFKTPALKKAEDDLKQTRGWALLYDRMARFLGIEPEVDVDDSGLVGERARAKLDILKKLNSRIHGRREEKLLYRLIRNFDMFTVAFLEDAGVRYIRDVNGKGQVKKYGYSVEGNKIEVYDGDTLAVMQYNVLMALVHAYIKKDKNLQEHVNGLGVDSRTVEGFHDKYYNEFSNVMEAKGKLGYAVFNALIYLLSKLDYKDDAVERFHRVKGEPDPELGYVYHRIFEV